METWITMLAQAPPPDLEKIGYAGFCAILLWWVLQTLNKKLDEIEKKLDRLIEGKA